MKKYLFSSFCIHLLFCLIFQHISDFMRQGEEQPKLNKVISVSFVVENPPPSENPGSPNVADKILEKKENSTNEKPKKVKEEVKKKQEVEKEKTFDSKVATKDAKEVKKEETSDSGEQQEVKTEDQGGSSGSDNPFYGSNFQANGDGSYTALSAEGISYQIISEVDPDYPEQAEAIGYDQRVSVKVKFLVGLKGNVESVQVIKSHKKLGFDEEAVKAVKKWRFKPIFYAGKNIKVFFVKEFVFNPQ